MSITGFEEGHVNPFERVVAELMHTKRDREIQAVRHSEIRARRLENEQRSHRVGGANFVRGNGGLKVGVRGKHLSGGTWEQGNASDSDDPSVEDGAGFGQMDSPPDPNYFGFKSAIKGVAGKSLAKYQ